jgi:hypothetical protein
LFHPQEVGAGQTEFPDSAADLRQARLRRAQTRADRPAETTAPLAAEVTLEEYVKELPDSVYAMADAIYAGMAGPVEPLTESVQRKRIAHLNIFRTREKREVCHE